MSARVWERPEPLLIAHQGGAAEAPASTLYAFAAAVGHGADMLELDVHATADGHVVVLHDDSVDRCTDGAGRVADLSLEQLQALDAAHWFVDGIGVDGSHPAAAYTFRGVASGQQEPPAGSARTDFVIPTLEAVLNAFPGVGVNIDIKQTAPAVRPYEAAVAETVRRSGRAGDVMVASFSDDALAAFRQTAPDIPTSAGPHEVAQFWSYAHGQGPAPDLAFHALQVPQTFGELTVVTDDFVAAASRHDLPVHVWTVDDEPAMHRLLDLGARGIVTDRPSVLRRVLDGRALTSSFE